ncbi:hypothetical protein HER15_12620 [Tenacibaculum mesophilum]|uniref:MG2 domain-containing protein n=1 Tax=Tenacibaculum mesophilum TaxID=104268 RepID=A0AAE9SFK7_9FLAO|nr:hypothetical protein [Tenacibaculum mesophilum]UTD16260.1 hypothetical protein HER15_12620 [Tenacibaculum mesophilum]
MQKIILYLVLFSNIFTFSQGPLITQSYSSYFENTREIPFLHINKTTFLTGQELWFKAYILEQNSQKLHPTTSNLYVSIFDLEGKLKTQKLIHIKNGLGTGNILLDSTFVDNSYYIKASTNWMKNFKEDNSFIQKISIINSNNNNNNDSKIIKESASYEFKLFPEGGHILSNTINNFGILIKNKNGEGIKINKGVIKNNLNEIVKNFSTNSFGLGNTNLLIRGGETYEFEAVLENGQTIKSSTPLPKNKGVTLRVINSNPNFFLINILTNKNSLNQLKNRSFKVLIHNTRKFISYNFNFNSKDTKYSLFINKNDIDKGVNIITVFDYKNTPILERLIFINSPSLFTDINIKNTPDNLSDSTSIHLKNNTNEKVFLSSSFLPIKTKSYSPENNTNTSFLLKPYIKGNIENPSYYFNNINKKKLRELDLLLITQGWSKYNWFDIFNNPPKTNYSFENGINIVGTLSSSLNQKQSLLIYSSNNNIIREIKEKNQFILKNTSIKKNTYINFGIKTKNNIQKVSPYLQFSNTILIDSINKNNLLSNSFENSSTELPNSMFQLKKFETLDEVIINKKKDIKSENNPYGAATMLTRKVIDNTTIASGETILDYLKSKNYKTTTKDGYLYIRSRGLGKSTSNLSQLRKNTEGGDTSISPVNSRDRLKLDVRVFLDENEISYDLWMLESIYLNTVKEIYYGRVHDVRSNEHIYIYTLSPREYSKNNTSFFSEYKVEKGFSIEKEYYTPEYNSYVDNTYKYYGDIFWEPNIEIKANSKFDFKIPQNLQEKVIVYIEGVSESGKLISKKYIISKKTNP